MKPIVINSPSLANCNLLKLGEDVDTLINEGVKYLHVDLMDGHYVPNLCFPIRMIEDIKQKYPNIITDVHIMVTNPIEYGQRLKDAGADYVSFHIDSTSFPIRTIKQFHALGLKAGVVINPSQNIDIIKPYIELVDMVTLMAVEPGFSGQEFMMSTISRTLELAKLRKIHNCEFLINIDGAITKQAVIPCIRNGANVLVTGIYTVFNQPGGFSSAIKNLNHLIEEAFALGFSDEIY